MALESALISTGKPHAIMELTPTRAGENKSNRKDQLSFGAVFHCISKVWLVLDCEQSLFCSKIPAGGAARKRVRYSSREPRAASSVGGRVSEEREHKSATTLKYSSVQVC